MLRKVASFATHADNFAARILKIVRSPCEATRLLVYANGDGEYVVQPYHVSPLAELQWSILES